MNNTLTNLSSSNVFAEQIYTEHQCNRRDAIALTVTAVAFTLIFTGLAGSLFGLSPSYVPGIISTSMAAITLGLAAKGVHSVHTARRILKKDEDEDIKTRADLKAEINRIEATSVTQEALDALKQAAEIEE